MAVYADFCGSSGVKRLAIVLQSYGFSPAWTPGFMLALKVCLSRLSLRTNLRVMG